MGVWVVILVCGWLFSFVGNHPHMWVAVSMHVHLSSYVSGHFQAWVVFFIQEQVYVVMGVDMDVDALGSSRVVVVVIVVMGCGHL